MIIQLLLAAASLQFIYLIVLWLGFSRIRASKYNREIPVSVIVCARNELKNLEELVPVLLNQHHDKYEVIIVDDRSDDGTYDYLLSRTAAEPGLKMVRVENLPDHVNSKKYALTLGIKAATNDVLLLTDADCRPASANWISLMANPFTDTKIDFVLGSSPYIKSNGLLNNFIRYESWLTALFYLGFAALGRPYMGVGRNMAYRKKLFLAHGGFKKYIAVAGGDDDLFVNQYARKGNTAICIDSEAQVFSFPKTTVKSFLQQKLRHLAVGKYYRFTDKLLLALFNVSFIAFWLLLLYTLLLQQHLMIAGAIFAVRTILLLVVGLITGKKSGHKINIWLSVFLDLIYLFYYLSTGARALFTKRVKWS
jgi:glycosyltransferase involved in cell wall biosynthesis